MCGIYDWKKANYLKDKKLCVCVCVCMHGERVEREGKGVLSEKNGQRDNRNFIEENIQSTKL